MEIILGKNKRSRYFFWFYVLLLGLSGFFYLVVGNQTYSFGFLIGGATLFFISLVTGFSFSPALIINETGICDRRLGVGMIPWADIEGAQYETNYNHRFICLRIKNPHRYVSKLSEKKRRKIIENSKLGFARFNIDMKGLDTNVLDIMKIIEKKSNPSP